MERPDLSKVDSTVVAYIEALEKELAQYRKPAERPAPQFEQTEPPTTLNLLTLSRAGLIKRTPRHLYLRQRRGGVGIIDLESDIDDTPIGLTVADESESVLLITNQARAFILPLRDLPETPLRASGQPLSDMLSLQTLESVSIIVPLRDRGYLVLATDRGQVRRMRHHFFGPNFEDGSHLYALIDLGEPLAACWSNGEQDIFLATSQGRAIRFPEQKIPFKGCQGIRLEGTDTIVSVTAVGANSGVFLLGAEGKGTIRLMSGFAANKSPGAGGKLALKTEYLAGAITVEDTQDLFIASTQSKIIRFQAAEVATTEGVIQGVNCMMLRGDKAITLTAS